VRDGGSNDAPRGLGILCSILLSYGDGWPTPGSVAYEARNVSGRQAIALFARAAGAARVLIAGSADALRFDVQRALGFNDLLDVADAPLKDLVQQATIGRLVNVAIEAIRPASSTASACCAPRARWSAPASIPARCRGR
jgi:hypothetical protein